MKELRCWFGTLDEMIKFLYKWIQMQTATPVQPFLSTTSIVYSPISFKQIFYIVDITTIVWNVSAFLFCSSKNITYICSAQGALKPHCWPKSEKGIRCESGTIPVAVYLDSTSRSFGLLHSLPLAKAGKARQTGWVRRPTCAFRRLVPAGYGCESKLFLNHCFSETIEVHSIGLP